MRRGALPLLVASLALAVWAQAGFGAFDASGSGTRSTAGSVVGAASAYHAIATKAISASSVVGFAASEGVRVTNNGTGSATFTWTTTSDPDGVVATFANCPPATVTGATCSITFTGIVKPPGTYTFTGRVDSTSASSRSSIPGISVTVVYCLVPPCA